MSLGYDTDDGRLVYYGNGPCSEIGGLTGKLSECPDCDMKQYTVTLSGMPVISIDGVYTVDAFIPTASQFPHWKYEVASGDEVTNEVDSMFLYGDGTGVWNISISVFNYGSVVYENINGSECCPIHASYPYKSGFSAVGSACTVSQ